MITYRNPLVFVAAVLAVSGMTFAQTPSVDLAAGSETPPAAPADDAEALAKQLANPVAALISVPFQFNADFGIGPDDEGERYSLNIQPVVPFSLSEDWNLITRTIIPLIYQTDVVNDGGSSQFGTGDIVASQWFSPTRPWHDVIWGVGPAWLLPTASNDSLGAQQLGAGPTGIALRQSGPWTFGGLANHIWKIAGDDDRADVNSTFIQPFGTYTTRTATSFSLTAECVYDWTQEQWTVPINAVVGQVTRVGGQLMQFNGGVRYYAEAPDGGPEWGLRFVCILLFPR